MYWPVPSRPLVTFVGQPSQISQSHIVGTVPRECPTLLNQGATTHYFALAARVKVTVSGRRNHINFCA